MQWGTLICCEMFREEFGTEFYSRICSNVLGSGIVITKVNKDCIYNERKLGMGKYYILGFSKIMFGTAKVFLSVKFSDRCIM